MAPGRAPSPTAEPAAAPEESSQALFGTWELVEFEGKPADSRMSQTRWTFGSDSTVKMHTPDGDFEGTIQVDPNATNPRRMEIKLVGEPGKGQAIFIVTGDELLLKINDSSTAGYAASFEPESRFDLMKFHRARP